jgi:hypothetical protein
MIAKSIIGVLIAVLLVVLYRGMRQEQAAVDPRAPLDAKKILAVLQAHNRPCGTVISYTPVGKDRDGKLDGYLARCSDGSRYIYFQSPSLGVAGAASCQEEAFRYSYRCPD